MNVYILAAIILAAVFILFWSVLILFGSKGDVIIRILEQTKTGEREVKKNGKFVKENEVDKIKISKKEKIPLWREYFVYGNKKPMLEVFRDINGDFHPIKRQYDEKTGDILKVADERNMKFWFSQENRARESAKQKQSMMEKVLPAIAIIVAAMMFFLSMYYSNLNLTKTADKVGAIEQQDIGLRQQEANVTLTAAKIIQKIAPALQNGGNTKITND